MTPAIAKIIGQRLASAREAAGLSQGDLCERMGGPMDRAGVSRRERGARPPNLDTLLALADALDVDPGDLLPTLAELRQARDRDESARGSRCGRTGVDSTCPVGPASL